LTFSEKYLYTSQNHTDLSIRVIERTTAHDLRRKDKCNANFYRRELHANRQELFATFGRNDCILHGNISEKYLYKSESRMPLQRLIVKVHVSSFR